MPHSLSLIAGGAGFIGMNLAQALVRSGREVVVVDNFSNGRRSYIEEVPALARVTLIEADLANRSSCERAFADAAANGEIAEVWHMAANSDIPKGVANADVDHRDTFLTTFEIIRAMQMQDIKVLHFASSSAIYGDLGEAFIHEDIGPLLPISNYGAMKLASEAQVSAAAEQFLTRVNIFRFPNVVGTPATHGVVLDFVNRLLADGTCLKVLGDGTQQKAYLHVSDLVDAMLFVAARNSWKIAPVNIGPADDGVSVRWIAEQVVARVSPSADILFGVGNKGWVGDVPRFRYSIDRLKSLGWNATMTSADAITRAIDEIAAQQGCNSGA